MRVVANSQLTGSSYGTVLAGEEFECSDAVALELLQSGAVRKPAPPGVRYETKVIVPEAPGVSARDPFHHLSVPHERPEIVASDSDPLFSKSDLPESRDANPGGRRGRR